ncbi:MAG: ammonium transporter [Gammaproteobacteria bacterium]|nr:ammonium transporter [Gammaproteobacteria bacterium]
MLETNYALDTLYMLMTAVLVMFMACGFSMLESGMVRAKNTAEILTKNVALYAIACIMYLFIGYHIMYVGGADGGGVLPSFGLLIGEENSAVGDGTYSARADYFFQVVFVATAMSIVSGAVAERMKLWAFLIFAVVLTGFIYPIQGMWKWGGGFLDEYGFLDFAGSGVVHLCGAVAALTGVLFLGARRGKYGPSGEVHALPGCNMPLATLGMFILWFGWFGFNGGSELIISNFEEANVVAQIFVNTNIAACGGLIVALILARAVFGKADLTMALNGALAGLVSITAEPAAGSASLALLTGAIGGAIVFGSIIVMDRYLKIDDPVGAISVHGVCGIWGLLAVCYTNPDASISAQLLGIVSIIGFVGIATSIVWAALKFTMGIRVSEEDEESGVDYSEVGIEAYPEFVNAP